MPNSLGKLTPDIVSLRVLEFIKKQFPQLTAIGTDLSEGTVNYGQQIIARVPVVPTVRDYSTTTGYDAGDAAMLDVPVTIDKHKHVSLNFGEQEISGTNRNLVEEQLQVSAYAIGTQVLADVTALITSANFSKKVVATIPNTGRDTLSALRKALTGAPSVGRYVLINSDAFEALSNDVKVMSNQFNGNLTNYQAGAISGLNGFDLVSEFPDLPAAGGLTGFAGTKSSLVFAARVPKDPAMLVPGMPIPGKIEVFTDPDTGLSIMARYFYDMKLGKLQMTLTLMYGVAVGAPGMGVRLATA